MFKDKIFDHIFGPNKGHCVYYLAKIFCNTCSFKTWGISLGYSPTIQSHDALRPIMSKRKYLMDYKLVIRCKEKFNFKASLCR